MVQQLKIFAFYFAAFMLLSLLWSGTDGIAGNLFVAGVSGLALAWIWPRAVRWLQLAIEKSLRR